MPTTRYLIVLALVMLAGTTNGAQEFADNEYGIALTLPDDWSATQETTGVSAIYDLPVLKYYELVNTAESMFIQVFFLDNADALPLAGFLTEPREGGVIVIAWHQESIGGLDLIQVGYEYDPPFMGFLAAEILHMVDLATTVYVYLQFGATVGVNYDSTLNDIVQSIGTAVSAAELTLDGLKCLYR